MSYEWLNGVDSSINFGAQTNQNTYSQNGNHNTTPNYNQFGNQNNVNQGMNLQMNQITPINNNSNRPLPNVPNVSNPQISLNSYNLQNFQQNSYSNANRPLPNIPQQMPPNSSGGRPLSMTPEFQQQYTIEPSLNQQFSGSSYQQPTLLNNGSSNSIKTNPYLNNTFVQAQNNQFMNSKVEPQNQVYQNTGLDDFEKIYGKGEELFESKNNYQHNSNTFNSNSSFQTQPAEKFTPNYDRIDYNNTGSIFGKPKADLQITSEYGKSTFLSREEIKNYSRWFNDIIAKKKHSGETIRLMDIFEFLHNNFTVNEDVKNKIVLIFNDIKQNIGLDNFFAVLRCLVLLINENGKIPTRELLLDTALPTLKPRSILAKIDDKEEVYEEVTDDPGPGQLDFDNFASLLMTGKSHRVKRVVMRNGNRVKNKSVRFSDKLVTFEDEKQYYDYENTKDLNVNTKLDFSLPMDQLMHNMSQQQTEERSKEDEAELADMKESLTHFQNLPKVDNVSLSMTGALPHMNFQQQQFSNNNVLQPLKPTATGSANYMMNHQNMNANQTPQYLQPTATGSANHLFSSSGRTPDNMFNTSFGTNTSGINDLKSIQDQIDFISAQMTGGQKNAFQ
ncbi:hypothetical protein FOG48_03140 [Hanseniaspora uvarum]|nr:hypothetical protein FOG48_03140 [Hanseniaspora uvarum]